MKLRPLEVVSRDFFLSSSSPLVVEFILMPLLKVNTYVTLPKGQKTEKAILFLPDVFGIYTNSQLLADEFAANGYATVLPDYFREDALKLEDMNSGKVDVPSWLKNHQAEQVEPIVGAALKYAKEELGAKKIGAVGYCFGAKVSTFPYL